MTSQNDSATKTEAIIGSRSAVFGATFAKFVTLLSALAALVGGASLAHAEKLNCFIADGAREKAGLPLHSLITDLSNQNTTLIQRTVDADGKVVEKNSDVVSDKKVSTVEPTERKDCVLNKIYNPNTQKGSYSLKCKDTLVQLAYDLEKKSAQFDEEAGKSNRGYHLKDCVSSR